MEFGAGRGKLSHWIHEALKSPEAPQGQEDLQLLLVERSTTRFKERLHGDSPAAVGPGPVNLLSSLLVQVDGKHQDSSATFQRLHVDIQHLDLSKSGVHAGWVGFLAGPWVGLWAGLCSDWP